MGRGVGLVGEGWMDGWRGGSEGRTLASMYERMY